MQKFIIDKLLHRRQKRLQRLRHQFRQNQNQLNSEIHAAKDRASAQLTRPAGIAACFGLGFASGLVLAKPVLNKPALNKSTLNKPTLRKPKQASNCEKQPDQIERTEQTDNSETLPALLLSLIAFGLKTLPIFLPYIYSPTKSTANDAPTGDTQAAKNGNDGHQPI